MINSIGSMALGRSPWYIYIYLPLSWSLVFHVSRPECTRRLFTFCCFSSGMNTGLVTSSFSGPLRFPQGTELTGNSFQNHSILDPALLSPYMIGLGDHQKCGPSGNVARRLSNSSLMTLLSVPFHNLDTCLTEGLSGWFSADTSMNWLQSTSSRTFAELAAIRHNWIRCQGEQAGDCQSQIGWAFTNMTQGQVHCLLGLFLRGSLGIVMTRVLVTVTTFN